MTILPISEMCCFFDREGCKVFCSLSESLEALLKKKKKKDDVEGEAEEMS